MRIKSRERLILFSYFGALILGGAVLLWLPFSWNGPGRLHPIDALFTATSAVCVTGLFTVDTSLYSGFGRTVVLLLIQFGGLGLITFMTLFLASPRGRVSFASRKLIGDYYVGSVEANPRKIVRSVIIFTLAIEVAGALCLLPTLRRSLGRGAGFYALFHAVSAFCNAGFSLFPDNLERYVTSPAVNFTVMTLIVAGGLGFVVIEDVAERLAGKRRHLTLHTRLALGVSAALIAGATAVYLAFEAGHAYRGLGPLQKLMAALFQSVTPRTAGFDTVSQAALTEPSKFFTMFLMYVGASPASTGGGIKTTTFFVVLVMILRGTRAREDVHAFGRRVSVDSIARGMTYALRAFAILALAIFVLAISELLVHPSMDKRFLTVAFEAFSAFGTVGLSLGLTPSLTAVGKLVIIFTMFTGRVGMAALAVSLPRRLPERAVDVPEAEVLIG
jgi:trk system potassium uptake protein TrkH